MAISDVTVDPHKEQSLYICLSEYHQISSLGDSAHIMFQNGFSHLLADMAFTMSRPYQTDFPLKQISSDFDLQLPSRHCETDRKTVQDPHTLPSSNPKWEWNIPRLLAGSLKQLKSLIIGYNIGY